MKRKLVLLFIVFFIVTAFSSCHRHRGPRNPYLHAKHKPVEDQLKYDKKNNAKAKRDYDKDQKKAARRLYGRRKSVKKL